MAIADDRKCQDWVDRTSEATDTITERLVESFRATLSPYLEVTDAAAVPLGLHWCLAPEIVAGSELGDDGHPSKGSFVPPVPLPRRLWASGELRFVAPLHIGDEVRRRSVIREICPKQGRSGALCFVTVEHELATSSGPVIEESQVIVYREMSGKSALSAEVARSALAAVHRREVHIDPVMLFRYSALTFNAHRIHYDFRYATEIEQYPDLVIHGPLQATLLMNFAAQVGGKPPRTFSFRALRAATGSQPVQLCAGERHDGDLALETQTIDGTVLMRATAAW